MASTYIERVRALGLPEGHYMVCGSAILELFGIRQAGDIDLLVSPDLFSRLESEYGWIRNEKYSTTLDTPDHSAGAKQSLDFMKENPTLEEMLPGAYLQEGIPFMSLDQLKDAKLQLKREKDLRDLQLIDEYCSKKFK
ncbi:MAG TPA: hypothetical protein VEA92_03320 [Candidatus Paceibacterota bacterium]|nr:hypothetical protein [Candidatus Paceibacterota bacterium]